MGDDVSKKDALEASQDEPRNARDAAAHEAEPELAADRAEQRGCADERDRVDAHGRCEADEADRGEADPCGSGETGAAVDAPACDEAEASVCDDAEALPTASEEAAAPASVAVLGPSLASIAAGAGVEQAGFESAVGLGDASRIVSLGSGVGADVPGVLALADAPAPDAQSPVTVAASLTGEPASEAPNEPVDRASAEPDSRLASDAPGFASAPRPPRASSAAPRAARFMARLTWGKRIGWFLLFLALPFILVGAQLAGAFAAAAGAGLALAAGARELASYLAGSMSCALAAGQILSILIALPWWRHIERRHRDPARRAQVSRRNAAGILALGVGFQFVLAVALTALLPLVPDLMKSYSTSVNAGDLSDVALIPILTSVIGAPISEELFCRGLGLTFAEKATGRFWAANVLQALMFGVLHGNLVQGAYAFASGLVLGVVYRRYRRLGPCIGLHLALNLSGYLMGVVPLSLAGLLAVGVLLAWAGWRAADLPWRPSLKSS